jgi:hypothetical protein
MTTAAQVDPHPPPAPVLGPVLGSLPDLVFQELLRRLGPTDLASLAGAGRGCAAAVASTALMQCAKHAKMRAFFACFYPLCMQDVRSHAACGGNLEVLEWLHDTGCPLGRAVQVEPGDLRFTPRWPCLGTALEAII